MTKLHLTRAQLLKEWRLRAFPEPVNDAAAGITRIDGIDLDALLEARMDDWYAQLLDSAPLNMLAPVEMADTLEVSGSTPDGGLRYRLPEGFKRLVHIALQNEYRSARILTDAAARLYDPRRRIVDDTPVALVDGGILTVYPGLPLRAAMMICDTGDGMYHIDAAALADIKLWI